MERLNLAEIIALLSKRPEDEYVRFDFGGVSPTKCAGYRGYYEDLAIGFDEEAETTVTEFLEELQSAIGKEFDGWKGGEYIMRPNTRVWVANPGHTSNTCIVGVENCDWMTVLKTVWME